MKLQTISALRIMRDYYYARLLCVAYYAMALVVLRAIYISILHVILAVNNTTLSCVITPRLTVPYLLSSALEVGHE